MGKVVLAYSGGLETSVAIHWLKHHRDLKVIALVINLGQEQDLDVAAERALNVGADTVHVFDLRRSFLKHFCWNALLAGAKYEGVYLLSAALSRPVIATEVVRLARDEGARTVAHASHPRGNDQFRLECSIAALDPTLEIICPTREWKMKSRQEVLDYAKRYRLKVAPESQDQYTRDRNLWGARVAGGDLEDITRPPQEKIFVWTNDPRQAPDQHQDLSIGFAKGEPVSIDGQRLEPIELMEKLNDAGAQHGVGRIDVIESRLMGFKHHEVYEAPGATILHAAHSALERLVLDKATLNLKRHLAVHYAETVYNGLWFSTLRESLDAFVKQTQVFVTGEVLIRLYKGTASAILGHSEYSTYDKELASLREVQGAKPEEGAQGMLTIHRLLQLNRAFKQKPRL